MQQKSSPAERRRAVSVEDFLLAAVGLALGLAAAVGYAVWRALSAGTGVSAWGDFAGAMLFPGLLIIVAVAAMVWLGWKANIDG